MNEYTMHVDIIGYSYTVIFTDDYEPFRKNDGLFGETNYDTLTIYIRRSLCPVAMEKTVLHELTHALLNVQGGIMRREFDLESLCEFVSWNSEYLVNKSHEIANEYIRNGDYANY